MTDKDLVAIYISDFSRGQISEFDLLDLPLNASPECRNVRIAKHGGLIGRYGYVPLAVKTAISADPDGVFWFKDANNVRRTALFAGGNFYDCTTGTAVLVTAGAYTAGNRIAAIVRNQLLIYSDGATLYPPSQVGQRVWDPVAGTEGPVAFGAGPGETPAPACKVMSLYTGQVLCGNCKLFDGTLEPETVRWSDVDFPNVFLLTNAKVVGKGSGGDINALQPFSISSDSLTPTDNVFVGKDDYGIFTLEGATSAFQEHMINVATGVLDGGTATFIPGPGGQKGVVVFLGVDRQVWWCDGTNADVLSKEIRGELRDWINDRLADSASTRFSAARDFSTYMYTLDCGGGRQYCYQWDKQAWLPYEGWPSGLYCEAEDGLRQKCIYVAHRVDNDVKVSRVNAGLDDDGTQIEHYWTTPFMKGLIGDDFANNGDPDQRKLWKHAMVEVATNDGANYRATFTANQGRGNTAVVDFPITDNTSTMGGHYDQDKYDSGAVYGDSLVTAYNRYRKKERITITGDRGRVSSLAGSDVQAKIEQTVNGAHFELNGFMVKYLPRGMRGDHAA